MENWILYGGPTFILIAFAAAIVLVSRGLANPRTPSARRLVRSGGFGGSEFVPTRGGRVDSYFDADQWLASNQHARTVEWLISELRTWKAANELDRIAFIEKDSGPVGLIGLQSLVGDRLGIPTCTVRLRKWPYLKHLAVKGSIPGEGEHIALVSDVATTGGHLARAATILRGSVPNVSIDCAFVLLSRNGPSASSALNNEGIKLFSCGHVEEHFAEFQAKKRPSRDRAIA